MTQINGSTAVLVLGTATQRYTFGDRAVVVLFRGAGGLLGSSANAGNTGIDALNTRLQNRFQDYYLVSQVFDSYAGNVFDFREIGSGLGNNFIDRFEPADDLGIVGYSGGGLSAIRLAQKQAPRTVDLLVQLDSYDPLTGSSPEDEVLPVNVAKGINYYQNANRFNFFEPDFDPLDLQGARSVQGSENINAEAFVGDEAITHRTLDEQTQLQSEILADIEEFVLRDLTFDANNQLALSKGAQVVNNTLLLRSNENQAVGQAFIAEPIEVTPDFSFSTRFEFRLPSTTPESLPGFSFWVQPTSPEVTLTVPSPIAIAFNPVASSTPSIPANAVAVLTPNIAPSPLAQAIAPLALDSGEPLTAWVNYDGPTDQLAIFLGETLNRPAAPLLTTELDLGAIVGDAVQFGFRAAVADEQRQADLLTWHLSTVNQAVLPVMVPETYLNLGLTQRAAAAFRDLEFAFTPLAVNGLEFSTLYDEVFYLRSNPDVLDAVAAGAYTTGYDHFIQFGWREGRAPSSLYDESFYLTNNPDVAAAIANGSLTSGFQHFVQAGHVEGRDPSTRFDQSDYLAANPDVAAAIAQSRFLSPFEHFVEFGAAEGRDRQRLLFQESYYLATNPDVAAAVDVGTFIDGFSHYLSFGCREGRNPSPLFNETQYLAGNPDVATAVAAGAIGCGWEHYLLTGRFEGR